MELIQVLTSSGHLYPTFRDFQYVGLPFHIGNGGHIFSAVLFSWISRDWRLFYCWFSPTYGQRGYGIRPEGLEFWILDFLSKPRMPSSYGASAAVVPWPDDMPGLPASPQNPNGVFWIWIIAFNGVSQISRTCLELERYIWENMFGNVVPETLPRPRLERYVLGKPASGNWRCVFWHVLS